MNNMLYEHGPGVALTKHQCPYCGDTFDGDLVIGRQFTKKCTDEVLAMNGKVTDIVPCKTCQGTLDQGAVFLIEVNPERSGVGDTGIHINFESAYRTGKVWALKEEAVRRAMPDVVIPEQRMLFIDPEAAQKLLGPMYSVNKN